MPVVQKTGPDGCLYILDWYDRYHCYQDANRDPRDRPAQGPALPRPLQGHAARRRRSTWRRRRTTQLIERLHSPNVYFRDLAQRLLERAERRGEPGRSCKRWSSTTRPRARPGCTRSGPWWVPGRWRPTSSMRLLAHADPGFRAWGVRAAGNARQVDSDVRRKVVVAGPRPVARRGRCRWRSPPASSKGSSRSPSCSTCSPTAATTRSSPHRLAEPPPVARGARRLASCGSPRDADARSRPTWSRILPRAFERLLARPDADPKTLADLFGLLIDGDDPGRTRRPGTPWRPSRDGSRPARSPARGSRRLRERFAADRRARSSRGAPRGRSTWTPRCWPPRGRTRRASRPRAKASTRPSSPSPGGCRHSRP